MPRLGRFQMAHPNIAVRLEASPRLVDFYHARGERATALPAVLAVVGVAALVLAVILLGTPGVIAAFPALDQVKAAGMELQRIAHYASPANLLDFSDRLGMLIVGEVGNWQLQPPQMDDPEMRENVRRSNRPATYNLGVTLY